MGNELTHHGIKGQKWGIRRFQNKNGSLTPAGKKRYADDDVTELSDTELQTRIRRMENEKRYKDLLDAQMGGLSSQSKARGKAFVTDVLEKAGKDIATQFVAYAMGKAVNKAFGKAFKDDKILDPKHIQKIKK